MATYTEIAAIQEDPLWNGLLSKVRVACVIKAAAIIDSTTPVATALEWARTTIADPTKAGNVIAYYVIAKNSAATTAQMYAATDAAVQTNVDVAVDAIYGV
mgnify:FL=1